MHWMHVHVLAFRVDTLCYCAGTGQDFLYMRQPITGF